MKFLVSFMAVFLLFSCDQSKKANTETFPVKAGCYGYAEDGTKITFQITRVDPLVQGTLIYDWAEKDRNSGSFNGSYENGLILGTYSFVSEGTESSREIAFRVKDSVLLEGYGEKQSSGKMTTFINTGDLKFEERFKLTLGKCQN
ncbi:MULTISPECIES: hypothetical protein [unclassified Leeuwenhoekiella]|uniref:hypothetical protein n=1 Tax=unclassified Leeuwenhoekiella TaxID=2615029 RepID=UPI000C65329B|nr:MULTISPECIES: hypothetical protein [unclassified Leeuwenhoekiella]MAW94423.1 hypothetical protein [Leeuwenhoekiella sp.]MBA81100.1 hypothetical protein [Leeuwenhoekiella sp.]|tara:strand:- start:7187 stop:7621 length:435 start_codon:yes stop_codon:yes gene_type:complete